MKRRYTSGSLVQTARTLCVKRSSKGSGSGPIPLGKARFLASGFRSGVVRIDGSRVGLPVRSEVRGAKTGTSHGAHPLNLWCRECGRPSLTGDLEACDAAIRPAVNQSELPGLPAPSPGRPQQAPGDTREAVEPPPDSDGGFGAGPPVRSSSTSMFPLICETARNNSACSRAFRSR